jgi:hypothetical protein
MGGGADTLDIPVSSTGGEGRETTFGSLNLELILLEFQELNSGWPG